MTITPQVKTDVEKTFKAIYDLEEQRRTLTTAISDHKKDLAERLQCKKKSITGAYRDWKTMISEPDTQDDIDTLVESLR